MSGCEFKDLADVFKRIIDIKGVECFGESGQVANIMTDFAPYMKVEILVINNLSQAGILSEFAQVPCPDENYRKRIIFKARNYLANDIGIRDDFIERCVSALAEAFGWNEDCDKTEKTNITESSLSANENSVVFSLDKQVSVTKNESEAPESIDYGKYGYKFDNGKITVYDPERFVLSDKILYSKDYTQVVEAEKDIETAVLPFGVESIGKCAFICRKELTYVIIPDSVTEIGYSAFEGCTGLRKITIPNSVTKIAGNAFAGCTGLTKITIPDSVTKIDYSAFEGCTGLTSIAIPNSVTKIGFSAFEGCTGLTDIIIPEGVTRIGALAFGSCTGLAKITIPDSVTEIDDGVFIGCIGLKYIIIPERVMRIGMSAFAGCTGLTKITIPNSVTEIGYCAFVNCYNLKTVIMPEKINDAYSEDDIDIKIDKSAFKKCDGIKETNIKESRLDFCHFPNKENIKQIERTDKPQKKIHSNLLNKFFKRKS